MGMMALSSGGPMAAICRALIPPQEMPRMPTDPFDHGLLGEPGDDLNAVGQLGDVVFVDHDAFGVSGAADIHAHERDPIGRQILARLVVAPAQVVP